MELPSETTPVDQPVLATMPWISVANEPRTIIWQRTMTTAAVVTLQPENLAVPASCSEFVFTFFHL